jgi:hypothetical protein
VSAQPAAALGGASIAFSLGGQSCTGVTDASGSASCSITPNTAGLSALRATFSATAQYLGSTVTEGFETLPVVQTQTTTSLMIPAVSSVYGGSATLTATLTGNGQPINGKTVTFTLNGQNFANNTATTSATGVATLANVSLVGIASGSYPRGLGVTFAGDSGESASSATAALTVTPADTTTSLTSATVTAGTATVPLTAGVVANTPSTAVVNEGTVSFALSQNGTPVGTAVSGIVGAGSASASLSGSGLAAGTYIITASYTDSSSPANFKASASTAPLTVTQTATSVVVTVPTGQYSDSTTLGATVSPAAASGQTLTGTLQFSVNGTNVGSPVAIDSGGNASLPYTTTQAAGSYPVGASFTSTDANFGNSSGTATLAVTREDAVVTLSATNSISLKVNSAGGTAGRITLTATIAEVADRSPGNISNAGPVTYTLQPVGSGSPVTCTATTTGGGVGGTLTAPCTFNSVPVNVFDVHVAIGGNYYTGAADGVLAVYDPSLGFTTGGGTVMHNGAVANFGFTAKYLKNGQIQGQLVYIEHRPGGDVILKSNAMGSLSIVQNSSTSSTALLVGKGTLRGLGNYSFQAVATDNGEPGTNDTFGLQVKDPNGNGIADLTFSALTLTGGNIQVPHQ